MLVAVENAATLNHALRLGLTHFATNNQGLWGSTANTISGSTLTKCASVDI
jgi:hypothetical protein